MGWYRVVKTIKGHRYIYEQRTWREGKHVRTESRYVGPADGAVSSGGAKRAGVQAGAAAQVNTTPIILYHGSPDELTGALEPSEEGTFGPGFYLTTKERAELYALYDAGIAAKIAEGEEGWEGEPQYDGMLYAFDVTGLNVKILTWARYLELCEALDPVGAATTAAKARLQAQLRAEGYDGISIVSHLRNETVIFPEVVHKLERRVVDISPEFTPARIEKVCTSLLAPIGRAMEWSPSYSRHRVGPVLVRRVPEADAVIANLNPQRTKDDDGNYYLSESDVINLPEEHFFTDLRSESATEAYYHSLFHELAHWTGHQSRFNRLAHIRSRLSKDYAREELVAQISAVILTQHFDIGPDDLSRQMKYFQHYLARAGNREEALAYAKLEAEKAVRFILGVNTTK